MDSPDFFLFLGSGVGGYQEINTCQWFVDKKNILESEKLAQHYIWGVLPCDFDFVVAAEEAAREEKAELQKEVKSYWRDLPSILLRQQRLHDIARKDYEVKNLIVPQDLDDQEQKVKPQTFTLYLMFIVTCFVRLKPCS